MEVEEDGLSESDDEALGEYEREAEALGETELEGEEEADELGEVEAEAADRGEVTLPNIRSNTAPVTWKRLLAPTAPWLPIPVKLKLLTVQIDQSGDVTGALLAFCCPAIFVSYFTFSIIAHFNLGQAPLLRTFHVAWL
jgi:hypothetical protein